MKARHLALLLLANLSCKDAITSQPDHQDQPHADPITQTGPPSDPPKAKTQLVFVPGHGIQGGPQIGDQESKFIDLVGGSNLEAGDMGTFWAGKITLYRAKDDSWRAIVRKKDSKIVQLFHCGDDWTTASGFGPSESFDDHKKEFGRNQCVKFGADYGPKGIGFKDEVEVRHKDEHGIDRVGSSFRCVTVYKPDSDCAHTDWEMD